MSSPTEEKEKIKLVCPRCKKSKRELRPGSLTAWVFRSSTCDCTKVLNEDYQSGATKEPALPKLGEQYEVIELIGSGGMGFVYSVLDSVKKEVFAVKILHEEYKDDKELVKRFLQEAKMLSNLDHPNLIKIHDHGFTKHGSPYLVMDFIEGQSLGEALEQNESLDGETIINTTREILSALEYIHSEGIIHRDLKPTNVLLQELPDGSLRARLVDFGIAKLSRSEDRESLELTQTGDVFGTPSYMSPEQCMGFQLDERSDIYSLGCLIYEMMTGHPPFEASSPVRVVLQHIGEEPTPPQARLKMPNHQALQSIVLRCMAKDTNERYQSIADLTKDFSTLENGKGQRIRIHSKKKRSSLSTVQALMLFTSLVFLLGYVSTLFNPAPALLLAPLLFSVLLPFFIFKLVRFYRKFGVGESEKEFGQFSLLVCLSGFFASALPVVLILTGVFEPLPGHCQSFFIFPFLAHLFFAIATVSAIINLFFSSDARHNGIRGGLKRLTILCALTILPTCFLLPNFLAGYSVLNNVGLEKLARSFVSTSLLLDKQSSAYERMAEILRSSDPKAAIDSLSKALEASGYVENDVSSPYHRMLIRKRSQLLNQIGSREKAILDISMLIQEFNKNHDVDHWKYDMKLRTWRGEYFLEYGEFDAAIHDFTNAISINPGVDSADAYLGRALCYFRKGEIDKAQKDLSLVLSLKELNQFKKAEILIKRAAILEASGKPDLAQKDYIASSRLLSGFDKSANYLPAYAKWIKTVKSNTLAEKIRPYLMRALVAKKLGQMKEYNADLKIAEQFGYDLKDLFPNFEQRSGIKL